MTTQPTTSEKPFRLYPRGFFFREESGEGLELYGRIMQRPEVLEAIQDALNRAYQLGFEECAKKKI